jgi:hypothetical protein
MALGTMQTGWVVMMVERGNVGTWVDCVVLRRMGVRDIASRMGGVL